jgi:hypothetical protein
MAPRVKGLRTTALERPPAPQPRSAPPPTTAMTPANAGASRRPGGPHKDPTTTGTPVRLLVLLGLGVAAIIYALLERRWGRSGASGR